MGRAFAKIFYLISGISANIRYDVASGVEAIENEAGSTPTGCGFAENR